jgi:hypothetical protein
MVLTVLSDPSDFNALAQAGSKLAQVRPSWLLLAPSCPTLAEGGPSWPQVGLFVQSLTYLDHVGCYFRLLGAILGLVVGIL